MHVQGLYNRSLSISNAIGNTFKIFSASWKTMLTIFFYHFLSYVGVGLLYGFILMVLMTESLMQMMYKLPETASFSWNLADYTIGSGSSRALWYYRTNIDPGRNNTETIAFGTNNTETMNFMSNFDIEELTSGIVALAMEVTIALIILIFFSSFVDSIFTGAMYHAAAEIYAGDDPTACTSIGYGWSKKWQIFTYNLLQSFLGFAMIGTMLAIPIHLSVGNTDISILSMLGGSIAVIALFTLLICGKALLMAAIPSIVVENKSPIAAFGRSWSLCKRSCCYIYCSIFGYFTVLMVISRVVNILPDSLALLLNFCINIATVPLLQILSFVLYMSLRIASENLKQDDLRDEIGSSDIEHATRKHQKI